MIRVVGIDPGTNTGFAYLVDGEIVELSLVSFWEAYDKVVNGPRGLDGSPYIVIEVARETTIYAKNRKGQNSPATWAKTGQRVGAVRREGELLAEGFRRKGYKVKTVPPRGKIRAKPFRDITGYTGQTNEHTRDAGMMAWAEYELIKGRGR